MSQVGTQEALDRLRQWIEAEQFRGYDPYDALMGRIPFRRFGKWAPILAIQIQKRSPINVRPVLGIEKDYNPKAMGLLLEAYSVLYADEGEESALETADWLFGWICENKSPGYLSACWGYNFDWASPTKYLPAFTPSAVVTGFVARGVFFYYLATGNPRARQVLVDACNFLMNDLPVTETEDGICFSYTPVMKDCCYNASLLATEVLSLTYSLTGDADLLLWSTKAVDFVLAHQKVDGRWNYSLDPVSGGERRQVDFHQGFIIDSLHAFVTYADPEHKKAKQAIEQGSRFYRTSQFTPAGRSYWRLPSKWPTDIHHQAQGILTFTKLSELESGNLEFAHQIADWTIQNMQDEKGYFYYRVGHVFKNRISFIRWGQAWMMVALARLLSNTNEAVRQPLVLEHVS